MRSEGSRGRCFSELNIKTLAKYIVKDLCEIGCGRLQRLKF
jgi:hypothetical protein